jgi:hypothetical protein
VGTEAGLRAQILGKSAQMRKRLSGIKLHACRPLQARDRSARCHGFVIGLLNDFIQIIAFVQWQAKSRLQVDVRFHCFLNFDASRLPIVQTEAS